MSVCVCGEYLALFVLQLVVDRESINRRRKPHFLLKEFLFNAHTVNRSLTLIPGCLDHASLNTHCQPPLKGYSEVPSHATIDQQRQLFDCEAGGGSTYITNLGSAADELFIRSLAPSQVPLCTQESLWTLNI